MHSDWHGVHRPLGVDHDDFGQDQEVKGSAADDWLLDQKRD